MSHAITVVPTSNEDVLPLRTRYRAETSGQITKDSIHRRPGWTHSFLLHVGDADAGFGSVAIAGPWTGRPTVFEFYVVPAFRNRAFDLFERFAVAAHAEYFEVQTSDELLHVMLLTYGRELASESIVFRDELMTTLPSQGARVRRITSEADTAKNFAARSGSTEWELIRDGQVVGTGGLMFHYNPPYCDVYMEIAEAHRRHGLGAYFVQELKRIAYDLGGIPTARLHPANVASRRTTEKAGFVPFAHIVGAKLALPPSSATPNL